MDNIINTLNLEKINNFIPYIGDTKYLIIIFCAVFLIIFILITILTKKNAIKKNDDVTRKQPNLNDIIDKRDIFLAKILTNNHFVKNCFKIFIFFKYFNKNFKYYISCFCASIHQCV